MRLTRIPLTVPLNTDREVPDETLPGGFCEVRPVLKNSISYGQLLIPNYLKLFNFDSVKKWMNERSNLIPGEVQALVTIPIEMTNIPCIHYFCVR